MANLQVLNEHRMRKNAIWCILGTFFIIACALNLISSALHTPLADLVKPALLPLLCATTMAYLLGRDVVDYRPVGLLAAAQLFGFAGDTLLLPSGFPWFISGMVAFLIGHILYMALFGGQSWKGLTLLQWIISLVVMAAAVFGFVKAIGLQGELFWPILIYGFALLLLIFSALAGVLRMPRGSRGTWWILLVGTLLFAASDACLGMSITGMMQSPLRHLLIMGTYLAAQSLLAVGGIRLILGK